MLMSISLALNSKLNATYVVHTYMHVDRSAFMMELTYESMGLNPKISSPFASSSDENDELQLISSMRLQLANSSARRKATAGLTPPQSPRV